MMRELFAKIRLDFQKYQKYSGKSFFILLLTQQGLWAIILYRINNSIFRSRLPTLIKKFFLLVGVVLSKMMEIVTGISLPYSADIGDKFYIGHFGGIIINSKVVLGNNCNISQGVTIGVNGRGKDRGVPKIGDNVYIGANAVIVGAIEIGNNVVIGANSLVAESVPANTTVLGVPAQIVSNRNSEGYI